MPTSIEITETLENAFQSRNLRYNMPVSNKEVKFPDLNHFIDFINKEMAFWSQLGLSHDIYRCFQQIQQQLTEALTYQLQNVSGAQNSLANALNNFRPNQWPCILSSLPEAKRYVELTKTNGQQSNAYFDYLKNGTFASLNQNASADYVTGVVDVVISKHAKDILRRATDSERVALAEIRDDYIEDRKKLEQESEQLREQHRSITQDTINQYEAFKAQVTSWQQDIDVWHKDAGDQFKELFTKGQDELERIKKLYTEQMMLKGPAQYWEAMRKNYNIQGLCWISGAAILSLSFVALLINLLYHIPSWVSATSDSKYIVESIRGTAILALIVSVSAYLIRISMRLAISAFHLSRDAKERSQLTNVYLSLLSEKTMDDADRGIVLQALFSRADTGLLKGDTSPTMPDPTTVISAAAKLR